MTEIRNAKITSVSITRNHGCATAWIHLDYGGAGQGFGGYALDGPYNEETREREPSALFCYFIFGVMDVVGVECWENLKGRSCRVKTEGIGGSIEAIGHFLDDEKWFTMSGEKELA